MDGLKREKEMIFQKIGVSPRQTAIDYSGKFKDTSSLSYREIEDDLSGESDRMKNARDQIYRLAKRDNYMMMESQIEESGVSTKVNHDIKKKMAIAKKLI
jgi:transcriptional regulator with AAA-type ATPase domain